MHLQIFFIKILIFNGNRIEIKFLTTKTRKNLAKISGGILNLNNIIKLIL